MMWLKDVLCLKGKRSGRRENCNDFIFRPDSIALQSHAYMHTSSHIGKATLMHLMHVRTGCSVRVHRTQKGGKVSLKCEQ